MEFLTGLTPEETLELEELLDASRIGTEVRVRGAVHTIRDMGELSFVVLRKRDGLLQCIFEEGTTNYAVKDLREEMAVEISGVLEEAKFKQDMEESFHHKFATKPQVVAGNMAALVQAWEEVQVG